MRANLMSGMCQPELFIDGTRIPGDMIPQMDVLVRPDEIRGMEVYEPGQSPAQFTSPYSTGCGSIVIWTQPVTKISQRH